MSTNLLLLSVLFCVFVAAFCERNYDGRMQYVRIKRGKYYPPPQRFYSRPPPSFPIRGAFSYTPPPGYMVEEDHPYPNTRPSKVSRPNEGLSSGDLNNIVKYLSKQDLDRIIEFAGKDRDTNTRYSKDVDKFNEYKSVRNEFPTPDYTEKYIKKQVISDDDNNLFKSIMQEVNSDKFSKYIEKPVYEQSEANYVTRPTPNVISFPQKDVYSDPREVVDNVFRGQNQYDNPQINDDVRMIEETLPKPMNLREDDYEVSFTNNVPKVIRAEDYEVKNFGVLPLMNYHSKLDTLSSYHVPHYTVTSPSESSLHPSSYSNVPLEPAPPPSAAKSQSDAHLKATKIWTHRSKGTAYTLHDDGSLTLEKPRPKIYGHA